VTVTVTVSVTVSRDRGQLQPVQRLQSVTMAPLQLSVSVSLIS
jgi:hypothetical protein